MVQRVGVIMVVAENLAIYIYYISTFTSFNPVGSQSSNGLRMCAHVLLYTLAISIKP